MENVIFKAYLTCVLRTNKSLDKMGASF